MSEVKPKQYCPFCNLELSGDTHLEDDYAWTLFNCEFDRSVDKEKPISEVVIKERELVGARKRKEMAVDAVDILEKRLLELGSNKVCDEGLL